jgi:hypothetical protein
MSRLWMSTPIRTLWTTSAHARARQTRRRGGEKATAPAGGESGGCPWPRLATSEGPAPAAGVPLKNHVPFWRPAKTPTGRF